MSWQDDLRAAAERKRAELETHTRDCSCFGCMRKAELTVKEALAPTSNALATASAEAQSDAFFAGLRVAREAHARMVRKWGHTFLVNEYGEEYRSTATSMEARNAIERLAKAIEKGWER